MYGTRGTLPVVSRMVCVRGLLYVPFVCQYVRTRLADLKFLLRPSLLQLCHFVACLSGFESIDLILKLPFSSFLLIYGSSAIQFKKRKRPSVSRQWELRPKGSAVFPWFISFLRFLGSFSSAAREKQKNTARSLKKKNKRRLAFSQ